MHHRSTNSRNIEISLPKKDAKWWPRLLKDKAKAHWLKVDFSKWKDEDESGAEDMPAGFDMGGGANNFDINQYMSQMGGAGGMGGMPADFEGLDDDDDDGEWHEKDTLLGV